MTNHEQVAEVQLVTIGHNWSQLVIFGHFGGSLLVTLAKLDTPVTAWLWKLTCTALGRLDKICDMSAVLPPSLHPTSMHTYIMRTDVLRLTLSVTCMRSFSHSVIRSFGHSSFSHSVIRSFGTRSELPVGRVGEENALRWLDLGRWIGSRAPVGSISAVGSVRVRRRFDCGRWIGSRARVGSISAVGSVRVRLTNSAAVSNVTDVTGL
eukprot:1186456-Prorocentrum_minimum.AAC.1